jgi:hypothetical protein
MREFDVKLGKLALYRVKPRDVDGDCPRFEYGGTFKHFIVTHRKGHAMTDWNTAEIWLERLKASGRASPPGMKWNDFANWLAVSAPNANRRPPVPLILAASAESAASKFSRLELQLRWAFEHGLLTRAIQWLEASSPSNWDVISPSGWNTRDYPTFSPSSEE